MVIEVTAHFYIDFHLLFLFCHFSSLLTPPLFCWNQVHFVKPNCQCSYISLTLLFTPKMIITSDSSLRIRAAKYCTNSQKNLSPDLPFPPDSWLGGIPIPAEIFYISPRASFQTRISFQHSFHVSFAWKFVKYGIPLWNAALTTATSSAQSEFHCEE